MLILHEVAAVYPRVISHAKHLKGKVVEILGVAVKGSSMAILCQRIIDILQQNMDKKGKDGYPVLIDEKKFGGRNLSQNGVPVTASKPKASVNGAGSENVDRGQNDSPNSTLNDDPNLKQLKQKALATMLSKKDTVSGAKRPYSEIESDGEHKSDDGKRSKMKKSSSRDRERSTDRERGRSKEKRERRENDNGRSKRSGSDHEYGSNERERSERTRKSNRFQSQSTNSHWDRDRERESNRYRGRERGSERDRGNEREPESKRDRESKKGFDQNVNSNSNDNEKRDRERERSRDRAEKDNNRNSKRSRRRDDRR